ncbi:MAG: hypothetical protein ACKV2T_06260 [Kofleriaceae bacterium]
MKRLALPILVFALLGIASLFIPGAHGSLFQLYAEFDTPRLSLLVIAFAMAAVASALALRTVRAWHGYVALGGFVLAFVKARAWTLLGQFSDANLPLKLHAIAIVGGVFFTLLATAVGDSRDAAETAA